MDGIKIPVEAKLDDAGTEAQIQHFLQQFNALGAAVAKLNRLKFSPIDNASLEQVKQMQTNFGSLLKVSGELRKRLIATGQGSTDFLSVDWNKTHPDEGARSRAMLKAFQYVTGGSLIGQQGSSAAAPAPAGAPAQAPAPTSAPPRQNQLQDALGRQGRGIMRAGLGTMGATGSVIGSGIAAGSEVSAAGGGMAGGIGVGLGVAGVMALLKGVEYIKSKVGAAQQEVIGYDTLKRTLGDVNVSFSFLRESLRNTARELDMTFDEALRHGTTFTRIANLTGEDHKKLGEEVGNAGGFSRSFGLDPGQGTAFFAQQRLYGVTKNVEESRRLGLMIGEGLAKAGVFAKADEVMDAIASFTQQQTRAGMQSANVGGYASFMTSMMGSGIPGTDPASTAALLARVNSAIASGGNAGEAGQNFMFSALGSPLGLNAIQTGMLREQGAFGTGRKTFGEDSLYEHFTDLFGGKQASDKARGSDSTNLQMIMERLERNYKGRPDLMANAMSNLFGTTMSQSMALGVVNKEHGSEKLGALSDRLKRLGVNMNDVNAGGISRIAQLEASMPEGEAKDKAIKAAATQNQEQTEGSRTRATINGVERAVQKMAGELVSPLNDIRAAVMYLASEGGKKSPREIAEAVARSESKDRENQIALGFDPKIDEAQNDVNRAREQQLVLRHKERHPGHAEEQNPERARRIAELEKQEEDAQARLTALVKEKADALEGESRRRSRELEDIRRGRIDPELLARQQSDIASVNATEAYRHHLPESEEAQVLPPPPRGRRTGAGGAVQRPGEATVAAVASARSEGLNDDLTRLMVAINGQESSGKDGAPDSNRGAVGGMQMLPETFARFSEPGWDIRNPEHNKRAAARYLKYLYGKSGGNIGTTAGAYYGGEGAIGPGGTLRERSDPKNPDFPTTLEYRDQVLGRMRASAGTPLPDVMSTEEAARARSASATPLPEDKKAAGPAAGAAKAEVKVSGTFQLVGPDGQPRAAPVETISTVPLPTPAGV